MNPTPDPTPAAVQETDAGRNFSLTVITGFAILGLLLTSIWNFGGFTEQLQALYYTNVKDSNYNLLATISILFEGKMATMLAISFGAGIVLLVQKKEPNSSIDGIDAHIRKQICLIILGLFVGLILLWPNDLLFPFGIVGILLFAFWNLPAKSLFIAAMVCSMIYCGKNFWYYADDKADYKAYLVVKSIEKKFSDDSAARSIKLGFIKSKDSASQKEILTKKILADSLAKKKDTLNSKQVEEKGKWEGLLKSLKYDSAKVAADKKSMRQGYSKMWFYLKDRVQNKETSGVYSIGVWEFSAAMFLGMALLAIGFFHRRFSSATYLILAVVLISLGVAFAFFRIHSTTLRLTDYVKYFDRFAIPYNQFLPLEKLFLATGYATLLMWLLKIQSLQGVMKIFSSVGRLALTNYFLQVLIGSFWFYGYGLGYYGMFDQWELYAAVAEITLVQIVVSVFWLRYYKLGPLEWAMKSIIYQKKFPNHL